MKISFKGAWDIVKYKALVIIMMIISGSAIANIFSLTTPCRIVLAVLFVLPFIHSILHEQGNVIIFFALFGIMFTFSLVANPYNYKYVFTVGLYIIIGYSMAKSLDNRKFLKAFLDVMAFMAAISIVCYFILNFTSINLPFSYYDSSSGIKYGVGYIFNFLPYQKLRNCGMFWEPGLMASFMIFSLLVDKIVFNSPYKIRSAIYILALILTNSSAGIILFLLYIAFILFRKYGREKASKAEVILLFLIVAIGFIIILEYDNIIYLFVGSDNTTSQNVAQKLLSDNLISSQRMRSVILWWSKFLSSPLFGTSLASVNEDFIWDTATSFMFLGLFGIMGISYTVAWIRGTGRLKLNKSARILLCLILLLIINKEPHSTLVFSWFLLFSMLCNGLSIHQDSEKQVSMDEVRIIMKWRNIE